MRVSKSYDFGSLLINMQNFETALNALSREYSSSISTISSYNSNINFSDWSDAVSTKLESFVSDDLLSGIHDIDIDISSGGFKKICDTVTSLIDIIEKCRDSQANKKATQQEIKGLSYSDKYEKHTSFWTGSTQVEETSYYQELKTALQNYDDELVENVAECNRLLAMLERINFWPNGSAPSETGTDNPVDGSDTSNSVEYEELYNNKNSTASDWENFYNSYFYSPYTCDVQEGDIVTITDGKGNNTDYTVVNVDGVWCIQDPNGGVMRGFPVGYSTVVSVRRPKQ